MLSEKNMHHFCFWHPPLFGFYMMILLSGINGMFLPSGLENKCHPFHLTSSSTHICDIFTEQVEEFFKIWKRSTFLINNREGYKNIASLSEDHTLNLRQTLSIAKQTLKHLHSLHIRGITQKCLKEDDIFVKMSSMVSYHDNSEQNEEE